MFYRETEFRDSPLEKVPKDWRITKMDDIAVVKGRIGWRGLKASEYTASGPYLIANKHLTNNKILWEKCDHLSEFRYEESPEIQLKTNDVIISKDGTIGQPAFVDFLPDRATLNSTMMLLRIKNSDVVPKYLFYFLQGLHFKRFLAQKISGTSIPHLFQRDMKELKVILPGLVEQRGIVEVLGVVDSAILKTDEVIAKTERLKKGLMQELLTKGIGHKEYKNTPIGKIPEEWGSVRIKEVGELQYGYTTSAVQENTGTKFLRITDIKEDGSVNWDQVPYCHIEGDEFNKYALQKGDLLFARIGATAGKTTYVSQNTRGIFASYLIRLKVIKENVHPRFVFYFTQSSGYWSQALRQREGQLKKGINATMLSNFIIPIPSFEEQQKIAEILSAVDSKLELEKKEKVKLELIKRGLMDLLLTGKVRVKVD